MPHDELTKSYGRVERLVAVKDAHDKYSDLVRADERQRHPVHRWYHFKESFSLDLLDCLLDDWRIAPNDINRILDPFCGVGTTLLAGQRIAQRCGKSDLSIVGFERNPFLHFVARTKCRWNEFDASLVKIRAAYLLNGAVTTQGHFVPELSTLERGIAFEPDLLDRLLGLRNVILGELDGQAEQDALLLGYASALEPVSRVRKDARALRIEPNKQRVPLLLAMKSAWDAIAADLAIARSHYCPATTHVLLGDGRTLIPDSDEVALGDYDLILYSPPYLNNIDYTEVYKIELWMCGFVETKEQFRALRKRTLRSHPSVRFPGSITIDKDDRMRPVLEVPQRVIDSLPKDEDFNWRSLLFRQYFDDIYVSLKRQTDVLRPGGWVFCVIDNSLHGPLQNPDARVPVAADLFTALIAQRLGLDVRAIMVARGVARRSPSGRHLRESIIAMRAPR